jgi:outer membrane biogenesis lipoprotein LolB
MNMNVRNFALIGLASIVLVACTESAVDTQPVEVEAPADPVEATDRPCGNPREFNADLNCAEQ